MQRTRGRVYGPYEQPGGRWRLVTVSREGARSSRVYDSKAEAETDAESVRLEFGAQDVDVNTAIDEHVKAKVASGVLEQSSKTVGHRLRDIFDGMGDELVGSLTPAACQAAYDRLRSRRKVDTHKNTLGNTKTFMAWCKAQGYVDSDPFAGVVGQGRRRKGKAQLTNDEARKLLALAVELGQGGDVGAVAVATVLLLAIRAGECAAIQARDLDDGGRVLRVPKSKTEAGIRRLVIPDVLRGLLKKIAPNIGLVFGGKDRHWVRYQVGRLCSMAGVPPITAHGLRGTHATLATGAGASSEAVAASLGHAGPKVTEANYIAPGAVEEARARRALEVLEGGRP